MKREEFQDRVEELIDKHDDSWSMEYILDGVMELYDSITNGSGFSEDFDEEYVYEFSKKAHAGQMYDSGESYFKGHVLPVVSLVKQVTDDPEMITVAYLHDVLEDTDVTYGRLVDAYSEKIADMVLELTKAGYNYFPELKSKECIIIKYADRLSNLSRMEVWDEERQQKYLDKSVFWKQEDSE